MPQYLALTLGAFRTLEAHDAERPGRSTRSIRWLARLEPKFDTTIRIAAAVSLAKQAARLDGKLDDSRAVKALGREATDENPQIRQIAVYALGFFGGPEAEQILRDRHPSRRGPLRPLQRRRRARPPRRPGRRVHPPRDALDRRPEQRHRASRTTEKQNKVESIQLEALGAIRSSITAGHTELAAALRPQIEELTRSGLVGVRSQALEVLQNLQNRR